MKHVRHFTSKDERRNLTTTKWHQVTYQQMKRRQRFWEKFPSNPVRGKGDDQHRKSKWLTMIDSPSLFFSLYYVKSTLNDGDISCCDMKGGWEDQRKVCCPWFVHFIIIIISVAISFFTIEQHSYRLSKSLRDSSSLFNVGENDLNGPEGYVGMLAIFIFQCKKGEKRRDTHAQQWYSKLTQMRIIDRKTRPMGHAIRIRWWRRRRRIPIIEHASTCRWHGVSRMRMVIRTYTMRMDRRTVPIDLIWRCCRIVRGGKRKHIYRKETTSPSPSMTTTGRDTYSTEEWRNVSNDLPIHLFVLRIRF